MSRSMTISVRSLAASDHDAWLQLWQGYQDFYGVALAADVTAATWARLLGSAEPVWGLAALESGRMVGLAHYLFHRSTWMTEDTCYLQDLFVAPAVRGQGIARRLVEAVYEASDRAGAGQVYWLTHETNVTARRLYDRLATHTGFVLYERFVEVPGGGR